MLQRYLSLYDPQEWRRVWRRGVKDTSMRKPRQISVSRDGGRVFVADYGANCVVVLGPDGLPLYTIPPQPSQGVMVRPWAVCVDGSGAWVFVGHQDSKGKEVVSVWGVEDSTQHHTVYEVGDVVRSLSLHQDRYLAVGTPHALYLLDVYNVLHE